jgi:hypothetical protein
VTLTITYATMPPSITVPNTKTMGLDSGTGTRGDRDFEWTDFTFTPAAGGKLVLLIGGEGNAGTTPFAVTWNNVALTQAVTSRGNNAYALVYYLDDPEVGSGKLSIVRIGNTDRYAITVLYATGVGALESSNISTSGGVTSLGATTTPVTDGALVVSVAAHTLGNASGFTTESGLTGHTRLLDLASPDRSIGADYLLASGGSDLTATWTVDPAVAAGGESVAIASFAKAAPSATTYASWAAEQVPPVTGDSSDDSNNDGVANGVAYFMDKTGLATNPGINSSGQVTWPNGGNIPSSAYGTQYVVQTSSDLQTWTDVPVGNLDANTDAVGLVDGSLSYTLTGASPRFVRLKVTPN